MGQFQQTRTFQVERQARADYWAKQATAQEEQGAWNAWNTLRVADDVRQIMRGKAM